MNLLHRLLCRSALWRWTVERCVIPWVLDGLDPGADVLELVLDPVSPPMFSTSGPLASPPSRSIRGWRRRYKSA
jgi:hypothetical protein